MHQPQIKELLRCLGPVVKDRARAERILKRYWTSRMALIWTVNDVHTAANERDRALTKAEAIKLLDEMHQHYNPQYGLKWSDFTCYIEEYELGRPLTQSEITRFVKRNQLTIARSR